MLLTIDPSIRALGWAVFDTTTNPSRPKIAAYGCLKQSKQADGSFIERSDSAALCLVELAKQWEITDAAIEQPSHYSGSKRSEAARNSGDILALMFQVATLRSSLLHAGINVTLLPVQQWKGNLPKKVTNHRIFTYWGFQDEDDNINDAVAIGDFVLRRRLGLRPWCK